MRKKGPRNVKDGPAGLIREPGWAKMGPPGSLFPFLATLGALLATWCIILRIFMHFYQVFMNIYAFSLKINGKFSKIQKITLKVIDFAQKDRKGA